MNRTLVVAVGIFFTFFAYFSFTAYHLPNAAGPDYKFSRVAADFYHDENRMAVIPDDEAGMIFSVYGSSRLLRPPLGFYLPAQMAKLPILKDLSRPYAYRITGAMLAGLTIVLIFLALKTFFNSAIIAAFGAINIALLPQFSFYASYFSDDMVAFATTSFLALIMVHIFKHGISTTKQILFAFAAGLCVVSKGTAWIFFAPAIVFYLIYMLEYSKAYFSSKEFYLPLLWMTIVFVIGGGWWLIFNMYHYGFSELILSKTEMEVSLRNARLDRNALGFGAQGYGIRHLIFLNIKNFLGATYIAFVGNLDWLRLKVGSMQYAFYLWILIGLVLNLLILSYQTVQHFVDRIKRINFNDFPRLFVFEFILYAALILQFYIYTRHNVVADIQIQGKYLMTIFVPMLILSLSFYQKAYDYLVIRFSDVYIPKALSNTAIIMLFALPVIVHVDALVDHVIPFYWPNLEIPGYLNWL